MTMTPFFKPRDGWVRSDDVQAVGAKLAHDGGIFVVPSRGDDDVRGFRGI